MRLNNIVQKFEVLLLFLFLLQSCAFSQSDVQTVYITSSGKKYHANTCRYLQYSSIAISLPQAKDRGYTACSVCKPFGNKSKPPATPFIPYQSESTRQQVQVKQTKPVEKKPVISRQCTARTKSGTRCKRTAGNAAGKCWQHR